MKTEDRYLKFVRWGEVDGFYVGYCPDLFPWGGVCHGADEGQTYQQLGELVREEVAQLVAASKDLTRPDNPAHARACRSVKFHASKFFSLKVALGSEKSVVVLIEFGCLCFGYRPRIAIRYYEWCYFRQDSAEQYDRTQAVRVSYTGRNSLHRDATQQCGLLPEY